MTTSTSVEYCLLQYVPNVLSDKSVSIAAIVITSDELQNDTCKIIYGADWQTRVRVLDPDADFEMLEALLSDIRDRLLSPRQRSDMVHQLEDSFSNVIQISNRRECTVASSPDAIEALARGLMQKASAVSSSLAGTHAATCEAMP